MAFAGCRPNASQAKAAAAKMMRIIVSLRFGAGDNTGQSFAFLPAMAKLADRYLPARRGNDADRCNCRKRRQALNNPRPFVGRAPRSTRPRAGGGLTHRRAGVGPAITSRTRDPYPTWITHRRAGVHLTITSRTNNVCLTRIFRRRRNIAARLLAPAIATRAGCEAAAVALLHQPLVAGGDSFAHRACSLT